MPGRAGPGVIPPQLATPTPVVGVRGARPPRINTPGNGAVDPRVNKQRQPRMGLRGPSPRNSQTPTPNPDRGGPGALPLQPATPTPIAGSSRHPHPDSNPDRGGPGGPLPATRNPNPDRGGPAGTPTQTATPIVGVRGARPPG